MSNFKVKASVDAKSAGTGTDVGANIIPQAGDIIPFAGSTAPSGWALCDGSNGTPDLRGKFVVGADSVGNIGFTSGGTHEHAYDFGSTANFDTSSSTHGNWTNTNTYGQGLVAHTHNRNFSIGTNAYAGTTYITSNAGNISRCLRSGHSHNPWNANIGSDGNTTQPHTHGSNINSRTTTPTAHTHTAASSAASGNTTGYTGDLVPYIVLNYIMKL